MLRAAAWSTLAAWRLVLVAVPLALAATGTWPLVLERTRHAAEATGTSRAVVAGTLVLAGLVAWTWKALGQSLWIGLGGRAGAVRASVLLRLSLLVVVFPLGEWVVRDRRLRALLWNDWPWLLALLVFLKLGAAAWVLTRLLRRRLVGDRCLVLGVAAWLAAVLALYGVLAWLVATPPVVPRHMPALVAVLAVPLVRLAAAPLALARGRHRNRPRPARAEGEEKRGDAIAPTSPGGGPWVPSAVLGLLAVPLVLVVAEAAGFAVHNRNNGALVSSGEEREYLLHVPRGYDPARKAPLVISLHGAGGWPALQRDASRWSALAESEGFIVVYPSARGAQPRVWRASRGVGLEQDVRFISDLIDRLQADYNVDPARIYADGLSNGGGMAFVLSCTLADRIAAVGMVAAAHLLPFDWCAERRAVPLIAFHGTADRLTPYRGGRSWVAPTAFPDIPGWVAGWARRNGCGASPVESPVAADVTRAEYAGCAQDATVALYTVDGGGHSWPGGGPLPEWLVGPPIRGLDATRVTWAFFRAHPLPRQRLAPPAGAGRPEAPASTRP